MDGLGHLLSGPRARQAFALRMVMEAPWGVRIEDDPALTLMSVARGSMWLTGELGEPVELREGDVAVIRGGPVYTVADHPSTRPGITILRGNVCVDPDGQLLAQRMALGVRTWGNSHDGSTVLLVGTWEAETEAGRPLLGALPPLIVQRRDDASSPLLTVLADEIVREDPGQEVVIDRLLDLVLVTVLRSWLADDAQVTRGLAHADPVVGEALRLMHNHPGHAWTIASLAAEVGVSRAALARRFGELVGEPPMTYLTHWRLSLAADLLVASDEAIDTVARRVGYGSGFALSAAFKRVRGVSPQQHRRAARG
ncbi:AraC-like DNA-binding protein [Nocardioides aromaticivorans]|uniref:AraC-like DNA-binding protein n=1 Tax=Nocardioides aromaticivorans TaxID=200618 RepID=A0A7Y9ZI35_9ACTN|nr:AraC family transcriptional regulator [Nocardioides aromaticivorans]NYI45874.1 AraC-like DNA-binding protein [Nocardioides aromaticivorans]